VIGEFPLARLGAGFAWRSLGRSLRAYAFTYDSAFLSPYQTTWADKGIQRPFPRKNVLNHSSFILYWRRRRKKYKKVFLLGRGRAPPARCPVFVSGHRLAWQSRIFFQT